VVLLKNRNNILPIKDTVRTMTVVGPNAGTVDVLLGNYYGISDSLTTLIEGIIGRAPEGVKIEYRAGTTLTNAGTGKVNWSIVESGNSDLTIACMGLAPLLEGEEGESPLSDNIGDRANIGLPASQEEYVKKLVIAGAKVVLVLTGGSPIALGEIADMVEAVVFVWYPGQEGGRAVADVLYGDVNPSGKLPLTFPKSVDQLPPFEDYNMTGRTYRYAGWEPLYPFGFGLSYTKFSYGDLTLDRQSVPAGQPVVARLSVANTGERDGEEVVQVYLSDLEASVEVPMYSLVAFQRVALKAGERKELTFSIAPEMMMLFDDDGKQQLEPGTFRLTIGGSAPTPRSQSLGAPQPVTAEFVVE
jgi:beta-glucosidase